MKLESDIRQQCNKLRNRLIAAKRAASTIGVLAGVAALLHAGCVTPGDEPTDDTEPADQSRVAPCTTCAAPFVERPGAMEFSGRLTVRPRQGMVAARATAAQQRLAGLAIKYYREVDEYTLEIPRAMVTAGRGVAENQLASDLMATGDYEYVVPDWIVYPARNPNDPSYPSQWHHPQMQSPQAWDTQTGTWPAQPRITLAFTDTGIDTTHPDLASNRVPGYNAVSGLPEISGGAVTDVQGHGTHVAGCGAAIGNNAAGVTGVGWNFQIMMVRVTDSPGGGAFTSDLTEAARWAVSDPDPAKRAKVVSTSYEGVEDPSIGTTGTFIKSQGGLYLYAAGNAHRELTPSADFPDVIIVGATDQVDASATFSNFGRPIDVVSPGVNILSTLNGGGYGNKSGTSMATPVANGVVGMIWAVNTRFTPAQVEGFLFNGVDDLGTAGEDDTFGRGRVNVFKSVQLARGVACSHDKCATGAALGDGCSAPVASIAAADSFCTTVAWDGLCMLEVQSIANNLTCPASQGTCSHTLCSAGPALTPGCDSPPAASSCVASVCAVDSFCCGVFWDAVCGGEVATVCGKNCN